MNSSGFVAAIHHSRSLGLAPLGVPQGRSDLSAALLGAKGRQLFRDGRGGVDSQATKMKVKSFLVCLLKEVNRFCSSKHIFVYTSVLCQFLGGYEHRI